MSFGNHYDVIFIGPGTVRGMLAYKLVTSGEEDLQLMRRRWVTVEDRKVGVGI